MNSFTQLLQTYFGEKAPALPDGIKRFIVAIAPWLVILSIILAIPVLLSSLNLLTSSFGLFGSSAVSTVLFPLIALLLNALALPGLFRRAANGWNLVFYSSLVGVVGSLLGGMVLGAIITFVISMYILFQVRSYYRGGNLMSQGMGNQSAVR